MVAGLKPGVLNQNMGSVPNPNPVCKCSKPTAKLSKVWELILLGLANVAPILRHHLHEHLVGYLWAVAAAHYTPSARAPAVWLARSGNIQGILLG